MSNSLEIVVTTIREVLMENGQEASALLPTTKILEESGLDSLGLADVVVRLEDRLHKDPFRGGFVNFQTIEELARLYE